MGTYPAHYSGGELICIGDEAELLLPGGGTRRVRIGALEFLGSREADGHTPLAELPLLHLVNEGHPPAWYGSVEEPAQRLNPAQLRLIRRSGKLYYNDGREMLPGDRVWENGERELYTFREIWRRGDPACAWYFDMHPGEELVLVFEPSSGTHGGFTCSYCDAGGHRSSAMDHLTFIERGRN